MTEGFGDCHVGYAPGEGVVSSVEDLEVPERQYLRRELAGERVVVKVNRLEEDAA